MQLEKASLRDKFIGYMCLSLLLPWLSLVSAVWVLRGLNTYPFKVELLLAYGRWIGILPLSFRRAREQNKDYVGMVKHSKRFAKSKDLLCEEVSREDFRGYWVTRSKDRTNIITILWIHGGGYVQGHPLANVAQCLRIAEVARQHHDCAVDIFALQYDLTPEAVFPKQINQAVAAYRYVLSEPSVSPKHLVLMGSSAGGHLVLSLLYQLSIACIARPGKAVLLYPWVNLNNSGPSVVTNKDKDVLDKSTLDKIVSQLLGPGGRDEFSHLVDFAAPLQRIKSNMSWNEILPATTWITVGGNDIFQSDIAKFTSLARADGSFVELDIVPDVPHGWLEYQDIGESERYLDTAASEDVSSLMPGAELLAKKICEVTA